MANLVNNAVQQPDLAAFELQRDLQLRDANLPFEPSIGGYAQIGPLSPPRDVMVNRQGDKIVTNNHGNEFARLVYAIHLGKLHDNAVEEGTESALNLFTVTVNELNRKITRSLLYEYEVLNTRQERFARRWHRSSTDGTDQNELTVLMHKKYCLIRLGVERFFGDEFQAAIYAVQETFIEETRDTHSAGAGMWALFFVYVLNGHLVQLGMTPICFAETAAADEACATGPRRHNSRRITVGGTDIKVEARDNVVTELRDYLRNTYQEDHDIPEPDAPVDNDDDDEDEDQARPVVRLRNLFQEY